MMRPTDHETIAIEKTVYYLQFPRGCGIPGHTGDHTGKHQCQSGGTGNEGEMLARTVIMVSLGKARQGKISRIRIGFK